MKVGNSGRTSSLPSPSSPGTLRMVFGGDTHLTCPADAAFEAWQITGPGGRRFLSLPGGDLGVWFGCAATENSQGRSTERWEPVRRTAARLHPPRPPSTNPGVPSPAEDSAKPSG
ncbi:DUF6188 family protein [Streptomyces sp. CLV115]|uniref:DUF6188 family protein n=1 Tax=Streptomyces sp. CLV115 TaxID=3138502 RepID=UPI00406D34DE